MCENKYCPISYGDYDCEYWREGECQYDGEEDDDDYDYYEYIYS